jgi:hypothetical protein
MAEVTFTSNPQPAPACYPPDVNAMLRLVAEGGGLSGTIPDSAGGGVFVGSVPPSSSLTNKVWFRTDAAGRPIGVFMFYNGNWRLVYTGQLGEIKIYGGNPAGLFDGTGRGIVGNVYDGWALCNGQNGTYNLTDRFIVCGTWNAGWFSATEDGVTPLAAGGAGQTVIDPTNLPELHAEVYGDARCAGGTGATELTTSGVGVPSPYTVFSGNTAVGGSVPMTNCPPYIALGYIMFIGYQ